MDMMKNMDLSIGPNFIMMIGAPGSGKTHYAKTLAENTMKKYSITRISTDDVRESVNGDSSDQSNNDKIFSIVYSMMIDTLKDDINVIYDATNCNIRYRKKVLNYVKPYAKNIIGVVSKENLITCLKQNASKDRQVEEGVIERMYLNLKRQPPTLDEGFDILVRF